MNRQFFLNALDISRDIDFAFDGGRQTQSQSKIQKEKNVMTIPLRMMQILRHAVSLFFS
jgi:hypothetical protein